MSLKQQAISAVIWTFAQQFSVQIINFGVQILLARLLMPEDFGLIAMLTVFIAIGQFLMDGGMTSSLIRTKDPSHLDYSTVFITNLIISFCAYLITYFSAPFIAAFYSLPLLENILKIYSLTFVIRSFSAVHIAKLTKEMDFKTQLKMQIPSTLIGGIVGVVMAYLNYGVWSLVGLGLAQATLFALQNWILLKWRPSLVFDKSVFKYHFNFGYKLTLSGIIDQIYNNSYRIIIGKFFTPSTVGFFNQADTMRLFPIQQISGVIGKVSYPMFSSIENDIQLKSAYRTTMKLVLFITIPVMLILNIIAEEGFVFLLGEKWLPSVRFFKILAIASIVRPISSYNLNVLKVKGRSDLFLKVEAIKKIIGVFAIVLGFPFGIIGLVISLAAVSFVFVLINMFYCGKLIEYPVLEQIKDVKLLFLVGFAVFISVYYLHNALYFAFENKLIIIFLIGVVFLVLYFLGIWIVDKKLILKIKSLLTRK